MPRGIAYGLVNRRCHQGQLGKSHQGLVNHRDAYGSGKVRRSNSASSLATIWLSSRRAADGSASSMACTLSRPPSTSWHGQSANGT